jgi:hypothetical protein
MHDLVSCWIHGGIGNQLFQIANAYEYSIKYNKKLIFLNEVNLWNYHGLERKTAWNTLFNNNFTVLDKEEYDKIAFITYLEIKNNVYNEIPQYENNVYLKGYFQSSKYFSENTKNFMLNSIKSNKEYVKQATELYEKIQKKFNNLDDDKYVFMHFRRTDYINNGTHNLLDINYYNEAYNLVNGINKYIIVFSDDIEWCKKTFSVNKNFYFIDINNLYVELILMTMIKNAIIANSTFSWWGAFLGNKNKVIVPKQWFAEGSYINEWNDIYINEWIQI